MAAVRTARIVADAVELVDSGWMLRALPPPIDVTSRFLELYSEGRFVPAPVLIVGGVFTGLYPAYLRQVKRALNASVVPIRTLRGSMRENAATIRDTVMACKEPVVLFGHSQGPLDIHAALTLFPALIQRVRAFISAQAPFGGTPLARTPRLVDLSYPARRDFLASYTPLPVPAVALASHCRKAGIPLKAAHHYLSEFGANDGFVPLADAHLPGAPLVVLPDLDHAGLALRWLRPGGRYDPGRVARALVALALSRE